MSLATILASVAASSAVLTILPSPPTTNSVSALERRARSGSEEDEESRSRPSIFGRRALAYVDATNATEATESLNRKGGGKC